MLKTRHLVFIILLGCSTKVPTDSTSSRETRTPAPMTHGTTEDTVISELEQALPEGWVVQRTDDRLVIARTQTVKSKAVNLISAPPDFGDKPPEDPSDWREVSVRITYKTAPPWSEEQWAKAKEQNEAIHAEIKALPEKYGLVRGAITKPGLEFETSTPEQQAAVAQHHAERDALYEKRIPTPDCATEHHSLFLLSQEGFADGYQLIRPEEASRESYQVLELIKTRCVP